MNEPCPFCGRQPKYLRGTGLDLMTQDNGPWRGCALCKIALHPSLWNTRPIEDALRKERDDALEAAENISGDRDYYKDRAERLEAEVERLRAEKEEEGR